MGARLSLKSVEDVLGGRVGRGVVHLELLELGVKVVPGPGVALHEGGAAGQRVTKQGSNGWILN